jgi:hypothetical protein
MEKMRWRRCARNAMRSKNLFVGDSKNGNLSHFTPNTSRDGFIFEDQGLADLVADSDGELQGVILGTGFGGSLI